MSLTKGQLKERLAHADAQGLPDSAIVTYDNSPISETVTINLGKYADDSTEDDAVIEAPAFGLNHLS